MRILIVCQNYYPEQFKINDISEQLVKHGHYVTVLTGLPNYPTGKIPREYRWGKRRKEIINGVNVIRSHEIGRKNSVIGLAINYFSFMISASCKALFLKRVFDIVFVYQVSPVTMILPGYIMKKRMKIPMYLYCCDIWPESLKNKISNENSLIFKMVKILSKFLYSKCDSITVSSKPFIEYFEKVHNIQSDRISYIPQHAEDISLNLNFPVNNEITDFVFMGNIGIAQDIDCILNAAERIKNTHKFCIHFVGDGSYLGISKNLVRMKGLENNVIFYGRRPIEQMQDYYKLADACLLTLTADNLIGLTMPSKLQGYMAAGKPVIAAINGAAREVIIDSKCGLCVNAGDFNALAEVMIDFIENPDKFKKCGENGRRYFRNHFTKSIYMAKLEQEFYNLVEVNLCSATKHCS